MFSPFNRYQIGYPILKYTYKIRNENRGKSRNRLCCQFEPTTSGPRPQKAAKRTHGHASLLFAFFLWSFDFWPETKISAQYKHRVLMEGAN